MYSSNILEQIYSHSTDEYPLECCGVILESEIKGEQTVLRCKNIQNEIHKSDPVKNPRDARTAYSISPADLLKINRLMREQNYKLRAIYHSHPDHEAYFSEDDNSFATFNDEPIYPGTDYIIVSVVKKKIENAISFSWDDKSKRFLGEKIIANY